MFKINALPLSFKKIDISERIIFFLLILFLVLHLYISTKILWIVYFILLLAITVSRMRVAVSRTSILYILSLPLMWGLIMSFNEDLYHIVQGFFYLSIPLILFAIGFQLSKSYSLEKYFSFIIIAGNIISLIFIFTAIIKVGFNSFLSPFTEARFILGSGSPACVLGLVTSLYSDKFGFILFKSKSGKYITVLLNFTAIYLFASRTYWVMLIIFVIIFSVKILKNYNLFVYTILFLVAFFTIINIVNSRNDLSLSNSIFMKLVHSFKEISVNNFTTYKEINLNYRGFEAYRALQTYSNGNPLELMFGQGLGKLVDLNTQVYLDGKLWNEVPVIHNGFFFILVKTGALGIIFILLFFFNIASIGFKRYRFNNREQQFLGVFILACGASLFMTNFVVNGLFNFEMAILILTSGFIISKDKIERRTD